MKLFMDVFNDDDIISDAYPMKERFGGVICEVKSRWVVKGQENVDIGCGNAFGGGEAEEAGGADEEKVLDLVDSFGYAETAHTKASFGAHFKGYMKKVLEHLTKNQPDRVDGFKEGGREFFKWINQKMTEDKDFFQFYTPKSFDTDNHIMLSYYEGEDLAPTFLYVMDGLKSVKM